MAYRIRTFVFAAFALLVAVAALSTAAPGNAHAATGLFAPDSIWNATIPTDTPLDPSSATAVREIARQATPIAQGGYGAGISTTSYGVPIHKVGAGQPLVKVKLDTTSPLLSAAFAAGVPLPDNAVPASGTDANLAIWQPSTDTMWEFWRISKQADGWHAKWGGKMAHVSQNPGVYRDLKNPDGKTYSERCWWGAPSSKFPVMAGVITIDELRSGVVPHALMLALHETKAGVYSAPAQATDGTSTRPEAIPMGSRFRLDPKVNVETLNVSPVMKVLLRAAQRYGVVVGNQSGGVGFRAEDPAQYGINPYPALFGMSSSMLMRQFPWDKLQMLQSPQLRTGHCSNWA
jgi:hypothetical protein